jgi:hypothetical protein
MIWRVNTNAECDYCNNGWLQFPGRSLEQEYGTAQTFALKTSKHTSPTDNWRFWTLRGTRAVRNSNPTGYFRVGLTGLKRPKESTTSARSGNDWRFTSRPLRSKI